MDLKKAFDSIDHNAFFDALRQHDIPDEYVNLVMMLYSKQTGVVHNSKGFHIQKGVKQGDVLSAIFFNCLLDVVFER